MSIADIQSQINAESQEIQQAARVERQAMAADCYPLPKPDVTPQARLYVIKDANGNALQAELHYYSQLLTEPERAYLKKIATNLVRRRYYPANTEAPIAVFENRPPIEVVRVLPSGEEVEALAGVEDDEPTVPLRPVVLIFGAIFLGLLLFLLLRNFLPGPATTATPTPAAAATAPTGTPTPLIDPASQQVQTNNLPVSKNANPAIGLGMTVRIVDSYVSAVRSEPGSDAGKVEGYLQDNGTAVVFGGPTWLQGNTDTIVWWYVQLPDGKRGWTPANTSEFTLLEPVP